MSQYNLNRIFKPRQVAVVGANEKAGKHGQCPDEKPDGWQFPGKAAPGEPEIRNRAWNSGRWIPSPIWKRGWIW